VRVGQVSIGIICRHCGARLRVPEKAAGKLGKCPKCKEKIRVPKAVGPEAHFCDRCEKNLGEESDVHIVEGKIFCGDCYEKTHAQKSGDPVLDQIGLNIPGLVVLRGKEQRQMGRMLKDVTAKKHFKEEEKPAEGDGATAAADQPEEPAPAETGQEAPAADTAAADQAAAAAEEAEDFLEEAPPLQEAPPPPPEAVEVPKPPVEKPAPEPAPAPVQEQPAAEAPAVEPAALGKGQRPSDKNLIDLLVEKGVVLEGELELALQYQRGLGKRLIPVLDDLKLTSENDIAGAVAESTGLELCPEGELEIAENVHGLLDDEIMGQFEVIPLRHDGDSVVAAFPNPLDADGIKQLREILGLRIVPKVCTWSQYAGGRRYFKSLQKV
jgi:hypothetical protein